MAFLHSLVRKCRECDRPAVEELFTYRNDSFGLYCGRHAQAALRKLAADEQARFARERAT